MALRAPPAPARYYPTGQGAEQPLARAVRGPNADSLAATAGCSTSLATTPSSPPAALVGRKLRPMMRPQLIWTLTAWLRQL